MGFLGSVSTRRRVLPVRIAIGLLAAGALIVSACAAPAPAGTTGGGAQTPVRGGTLTIDLGAEKLAGLDHTAYDGVDRDVANLVVETLVWYDDANLKIAPRLAKSWKVESDNLTWVFELQQGVKFHDGTPFNAQAVRAEFERKMKTENALAFRNVGRHLDSVEAVGESTVRLKTKVPFPIFPNILLGYGSEISSPAAVEKFGKDIGVKQVGTGPFKVESMVAGGTLNLVRNEEYSGEKPVLDKIVLMSITDPSARTAALISGQTDVMWDAPPSQLAALERQSTVKIEKSAGLTQLHWAVNVHRPPLDKPEVRQAFNYAVDMKEISEVAWEGLRKPFQGPVNPLLYTPDASLKGYTYDPAKARELLEKAGATGLKLQYLYRTDPALDREAQILQAQFAKVGVTLELVPLEQAALAQRTEQGALKFDITPTSWSNSQLTASPALGNLMRSGGSSNFGRFSDPKIDALIARLEAEFDQAKRSDIVNELAKEYFTAAPWFGGYSAAVAYAWADRVKNFDPPAKEAFFPGLIKVSRSN
jgi:peptide/nickel transport system substrate-binding protein